VNEQTERTGQLANQTTRSAIRQSAVARRTHLVVRLKSSGLKPCLRKKQAAARTRWSGSRLTRQCPV